MQHFLWPIFGAIVTILTRDPKWVGAAVLLSLARPTWRAYGQWTPSGRFGWANTATWLRALGVYLMLVVSEAGATQFIVAFVLLLADGLDGKLARWRGESSEFGACLDKETDAFFVLSLCTLLWLQGGAGLWVFVAGLWRYAYGLFIESTPRVVVAPRSAWGRVFYTLACIALILAICLPWPASAWLAALGVVLISASFLRSIFYSLRS